MPLVACSFGLAIACGLLISEAAGESAAFVALAVIVFYCALRPSGRWTVFAISALPVAGSAIAADVLDVSRAAAALPLIPVMLLALANQDREDRARRAGPA